MNDRTRLSLANNPISYLGGILAAVSFIAVVVLLILEFSGSESSPYIGVITYLVLPVFLGVGLLLVPLGMWHRRRQLLASGLEGTILRPYPMLDLNDAVTRRNVALFSMATVAIVGVLGSVAYKGTEFADSVTFCGQVCHQVMEPQYAPYLASPHARVDCVHCHIGPGASWFVRSKLSGVYQVYATLLNKYPRPIPAPIENLRPSRDTCERCHWPDRFYGKELVPFVTYASDEANTPQVTTFVFKVGAGGEARHDIHWHVASRLWYYALDKSRQKLGWVGVEGADGRLTEYVLPEAAERLDPAKIESEKRLLDCIDCHNRAAHEVKPFAKEVDEALRIGEIDRTIPFIKKLAVEAVPPEAADQFERYDEIVKRLEGIEDYYRQNYAQYYAQNQDKVKNAVDRLKKLYARSSFPEMRVGAKTYPNWRTHEGCFRCHNTLKEKNTGKVVSGECNRCHEMVSSAQAEPAGR